MGPDDPEDESYSDAFETAPFRKYVRDRIVRDFAQATYNDVGEGDEKAAEPLDVRLYPVELVARIRAATLTKTPDEAYENSFDYLHQIIEEAADVARDRPYRAFRDQWIERWGNFLTDFDKGNHVLVILAQEYYNVRADDYDGEIRAELDRYVLGNSGGQLRDWMEEERLVSKKEGTTDWYDGAAGEDPGEQSKWRDYAQNIIGDSGGELRSVMHWALMFVSLRPW